MVKKRAGAGAVEISGAMLAAGGTVFAGGAIVPRAGPCMASAMTKGSFVADAGGWLGGRTSASAGTAAVILTCDVAASGVASASTTAAAVTKPKNTRTGSHWAAPCGQAFALMFNTPFRGVDRPFEKAARSGFFTELAIRPGLLRSG